LVDTKPEIPWASRRLYKFTYFCSLAYLLTVFRAEQNGTAEKFNHRRSDHVR